MRISEKIKMIHAISKALSREEWRLIDFTLSQYGLPTTQQWDGNDKEGYIIEMINSGKEPVLVELAKHLGVASELESSEEPSFWSEIDTRVFICHLAKEKIFASDLRDELAKFNIIGFVAHEDIEPSREWQNEIEIALSTMDGLIANLHLHFHESNWTDQEIGVAIGRRIPIIPIKLGIDPYGFIGKYQALNGAKMAIPEIARRVIEIFASKPQIGSKVCRSLAKRLKKSPNWATSKLLVDLLEKCQYFHPELTADLLQALKENDQVSSAWGVRDRITKLLSSEKA